MDLDSDPLVMKFLSDGKPTSREEAEKTIKVLLERDIRWNHKMGVFPTYLKENNEFVGWFLLRPPRHDLDNFSSLELGYRLKRKFWGQGFATETSRLLLAKAFNDLNADSVFATAMAANDASTGVMKKIGMKFDSHFIEDHFPGADKRAVKYLITQNEWRALNK